jgi:hypothetical protein
VLYDDEREVSTTKGEVDDGERGCCVQGWDDVWWRFDKRNEASIIQGSSRKRKCICVSRMQKVEFASMRHGGVLCISIGCTDVVCA